ncbi:hypothetical protein EDB19DRAFT_1903706 [Suillus lakei]|nr:hypothetical protein EDB19DRAFT_1903706 [Suillus lakei]
MSQKLHLHLYLLVVYPHYSSTPDFIWDLDSSFSFTIHTPDVRRTSPLFDPDLFWNTPDFHSNGLGCHKKVYKSTETIKTNNEDEITPAANASSPSANIPSTNISTNSTSNNTNDNASTNTNVSANSNINTNASASTNFTNTEAFNNANTGTFNSINPTAFNPFHTPTPPAISSAPVSPSNKFFDPDTLLSTLDTILGQQPNSSSIYTISFICHSSE